METWNSYKRKYGKFDLANLMDLLAVARYSGEALNAADSIVCNISNIIAKEEKDSHMRPSILYFHHGSPKSVSRFIIMESRFIIMLQVRKWEWDSPVRAMHLIA